MKVLSFKEEKTASEIAALSGSYKPGSFYAETDTGVIRRAIDANTLSGEMQFGSAAADLVQQNLDNYIASNDIALDAERQARIDADVVLQTAIDTKAATSYVNTELALKVSQSDYDTKVGELEGKDTAQDSVIATNTSGLAAEITRATAAEGVNATAISDEETRATGVEAGLQTSIDTEKGRIDAILAGAGADSDTFAEIVALVNSVDTENDNAFAGYVVSNDAALAAETQARIDADAALQLDINTRALDSEVVHLAGAESITGLKTFSETVNITGFRKGLDVYGSSATVMARFREDGIVLFDSTQTNVAEFAKSGMTSPKGSFDQSISLKDRTTGTQYYLQVDNGDFYVSTAELA